MISVLILTKNEELDLPECLDSVSWCDDIHVLDSFSNDQTVAIANSYGAKVTQRKFDNYSAQRNAGLQDLSYKYKWLFILDADERIPNNLVEEIGQVIANVKDNVSGFRIRRRDFLENTWLKHSQISPFYVRLVRIGKASYHREINEVIEIDGDIQQLTNYFNHFPFSKGYDHWLSKHNQYSAMEAQRWMDENDGNTHFSIKKALLSKDFSEKRYHQKGLFYKIPGRPVLKWLYMMFWRMSFLDGKAGLRYANLQAIYEYLIVIKANELVLNRERKN